MQNSKPIWTSKGVLLALGSLLVFGGNWLTSFLSVNITPEQMQSIQDAYPQVLDVIHRLQSGESLLTVLGIIFSIAFGIIRTWFIQNPSLRLAGGQTNGDQPAKPWYRSKIVLLCLTALLVFGGNLLTGYLSGRVTPEQLQAIRDADPMVWDIIHRLQSGESWLSIIGTVVSVIGLIIRTWFIKTPSLRLLFGARTNTISAAA